MNRAISPQPQLNPGQEILSDVVAEKTFNVVAEKTVKIFKYVLPKRAKASLKSHILLLENTGRTSKISMSGSDF